MKVYRGAKGRDIYTYDETTNTVTDKVGNRINMIEPLDGANDIIVAEFIVLMFKQLYKNQNDLADLCRDLKGE